jgi:hypothetical protein
MEDYLAIVKNPIWLDEIVERLRCSCYNYVHEWVRDMQGIWENAIAYNAPDSLGYDCALVLKSIFERKYQPVPNCEEDLIEIKRVRLLKKIQNLLEEPPKSVKDLSWNVPKFGENVGGFEKLVWDCTEELEMTDELKVRLVPEG